MYNVHKANARGSNQQQKNAGNSGSLTNFSLFSPNSDISLQIVSLANSAISEIGKLQEPHSTLCVLQTGPLVDIRN